jgi:hypothetical protein
VVPSDFIDAFPASTMTQDVIFLGESSALNSSELLQRFVRDDERRRRESFAIKLNFRLSWSSAEFRASAG